MRIGMGDTGLEPVTSCVSIRRSTYKSLFGSSLSAHLLSIYRKYTGSIHTTHSQPTQNLLLTDARLPLGVGGRFV